ncbi:DUF2460 domain-containing protein [Variovorax sp. RT4R15]|uniref:DUF2460 domain-containing protein n=1 Tax=Variovorax sp. RT4R15 TaxID=3443737 RepID=UPI003F4617AC
MTFIDAQLNRRVNVGFRGGPSWNTLVKEMANGKNRRRQDWALPHHKYTADWTLLNPIDQNDVLAAFIACRGQLHSFRFKDWNDFRATSQTMAVGDGTSTARQLTKTYTFGSTSFVRTITLPIASTVVITANGTPIAVTTDPLTGLATPAAPWPSGQVIKSSFEFDVRVRFAADFIPFDRDTVISAAVSIDLVEDFVV